MKNNELKIGVVQDVQTLTCCSLNALPSANHAKEITAITSFLKTDLYL